MEYISFTTAMWDKWSLELFVNGFSLAIKMIDY